MDDGRPKNGIAGFLSHASIVAMVSMETSRLINLRGTPGNPCEAARKPVGKVFERKRI